MSAFSDEETMLLITIFGQPEVQLKFKSQKKSHVTVWKEIAGELSVLSEGKFSRTHQQCKDRMGNLKKKFFSLKRDMRSGDTTPTWQFWDEMNGIFGPRPTTNPHTLVDTLEEATTSNDDTSFGSNVSANFLTTDDSFVGDDSSSNPSSRGSSISGTLKRCKPMPCSARRNKMKNNENSDDMIQLLKQMQEKEEEYFIKQETRDAQFLKILGDLSTSVKKIASNNDGYDGSATSSSTVDGVQYIYFQKPQEDN